MMGALHLVNRSPGESSCLLRCLQRVGAGDAVLLIESGVYAVIRDSAFAPLITEALPRICIHALEPDLWVRGITAEEILDGVSLVDYEGFVELSLSHYPIQSWF